MLRNSCVVKRRSSHRYLGQFEGLPILPALRVYEPRPYDEVQMRHIAGLLGATPAPPHTAAASQHRARWQKASWGEISAEITL